MSTTTDQSRIDDMETAFYSLITLQAVAQGIESATADEIAGVQMIFAEAMERIKLRVAGRL